MATNAFQRDRAEEEQHTSTWKIGNALSHGQLAIQRLQYGNAVPVALTFSMRTTRWVFLLMNQNWLLDLILWVWAPVDRPF